jgi:hypothetical protein
MNERSIYVEAVIGDRFFSPRAMPEDTMTISFARLRTFR